MRTVVSSLTTVRAKPRQLSRELDGERIVLDLDGGRYYGLDEVGARIFALVSEPRTIAQVRDALVAEYDIAPDRCEREVIAFVHQLAGAGLLEIADA